MKPRITSTLQLPPDPLREKIRACVHELSDSCQESERGIYAQMVLLGIEKLEGLADSERTASIKEFRVWLTRDGLSGPRASEITTILRADATARRFAAGQTSVRHALEDARKAKKEAASARGAKTPPKVVPENKKAEQASKYLLAALNRLLKIKKTSADWFIDGTVYLIRFRRAAPAAS